MRLDIASGSIITLHRGSTATGQATSLARPPHHQTGCTALAFAATECTDVVIFRSTGGHSLGSIKHLAFS